jgi:hypothetical protein
MELKDIIRNTTDTQPFNNFEVAVLREIYRTLGGKIKDSRRTDFYTLMNSNIIGNLALDKDMLMYFYSLYKNNLDKVSDGDFSSIEEVVVPHMKEYEVKIYQNVDSWREVTNSVVASDSDDASDATDWEHDYGDVLNPKLTTHLDDSIEQGEIGGIVDLDVNVIRTLNESIKKRKIIINESQLSKIEEDLKYWSVSDANPNKNKYEMGVELEEEVSSIPIYKDNNPHKKIYEKMRMEFPNAPEYILQDYFRNVILMNAPHSVPPLKEIINTYNGDPIPYIKGDGNGWWYNYLNGPWKLQVLNVNPMDFADKTIRAFEERDFGKIDAYNVPYDKERMDTQMNMRRDDGMNEPVIVLIDPDGKYELMEGWHRTMSILKMGDKPKDNYYDEDDNDELWDEEIPTELKDWDKVKLKAFVVPNPDYIKK